MVNYENGKIYKIEALNGDAGDIYIGSTAQPFLSYRMSSHRSGYKIWKDGKGPKVTSYILFDKYGIENCSITLIENVNATSSDELRAREAYHIKSLECVNRCMPLRSRKENSRTWYDNNREGYDLYKKEWYQINKEEILIQRKLWYENRKEEYKITNKLYYEKNKEEILKQQKKYYENSKEEILNRQKLKRTKNP